MGRIGEGKEGSIIICDDPFEKPTQEQLNNFRKWYDKMKFQECGSISPNGKVCNHGLNHAGKCIRIEEGRRGYNIIEYWEKNWKEQKMENSMLETPQSSK